MQSVLGQTYSKIEYIVIDGGSTDGSKAYIENCKQDLAYWVSEPDRGIYHAMNKGIKKASGNYLLFLNSGDWLMEKSVIDSIKPNEFSHDIISCNLFVEGDNKGYVKAMPKDISFSFLFKGSLSHPSTFIKRDLFTKYGNYDENLKIVSDWKFFILAICKHKATYKNILTVLTNFNLLGCSSGPDNIDLINQERQTILMEEFGPFYKDMEEYLQFKLKISSLRKSKWVNLLLKTGLINKF